MRSEVVCSLLGPVEARLDGAVVDVGGRNPRLVMAMLAAAAGRPVSAEVIADALWGDAPPATAVGTLQSYVSRLRSQLGADVLRRDPGGYWLDVGRSALPHLVFEDRADRGRDLLAAGSAEAAHAALVEAERLWRGPALGELADVEALRGLAARLDERRLAAVEDRLAAALALGRHAAVVAELGELVARHPLREDLRSDHALALYRSGRQADALRALADAAATLRDELGIEPSRRLQDLEAAILAQDPDLLLPPATDPVRPPSAPPRTTGPSTSLVGREAEWAALVEAWEQSRHDGRIVVIEGEPGIGKTRLGEELRAAAAAEGAVAVWGRADEGGAAPALWPWLPPIRALVASGVAAPRPVLDLIEGGTAGSPSSGPAAEFVLFEAVGDLVAAVAATQPVVVLIDDLQWADAASLSLLGFLADRLAPGVTVVATLRRLELGRQDDVTTALARVARRPGSRRLILPGLAPDATATILATVDGEAIAPEVASAIHVRAEGNPFYAIELARLRDDEGGSLGEVPASVGEVVRRRLARLPGATREALQVAAVIGRDLRLGLLATVLGVDLDDALDTLDPAVAHRLLVESPDGIVRFSHALVREVLVEDLTALRRARIHLRVADGMEAQGAGVDEVEMLADHLWRAATVGAGRRAAEALEKAADVALARVAYGPAEDLLTKAARLRRSVGGGTAADERSELATILRLLEVARARRYFEAVSSVEAYDRAVELARRLGDGDALLVLLWFSFSADGTSGDVAAARISAREVVALTHDHPDPAVRSTASSVEGTVAWLAGRTARAVEHFDTARDLLEEARPPTDPLFLERALVTRCLGLVLHALRGDRPVADLVAEYDRLAGDMPDPFAATSVLAFGATCALIVDDDLWLDRYVGRAQVADPAGQFLFWQGQVLMVDGVRRARRGEVDTARFRTGREVYTSVRGGAGLVLYEASMALALVGAGSLDEAGAFVADGAARLARGLDLWAAPVLTWAGAEVARARGAPEDEVRAALTRAIEEASEQGSLRLVERVRSAAGS